MGKKKKPDAIDIELDLANNLIETTKGYVDLPEGFDEDSYYYYRTGGTQLNPVQLIGGMIQKLKNVNGTVEGPSKDLPHTVKLFTLRGMTQGPELQALIRNSGNQYSKDSPSKYIEAAHKYAELRKKIMHKMLTVEEAALLYQGDQTLLTSTQADYSLGYNEDAYIKSSIAYETEMYLRSIFSSYGLLDSDMKPIFHSHDLREAFLKLPRSIKTQVYQLYRDELKQKALMENVQYFIGITKGKNIETILSYYKKEQDTSSKTYLQNILNAYKFIKDDVAITHEAKDLIDRIQVSLVNPVVEAKEEYTNELKEINKVQVKPSKHMVLSKAYIKYEQLGIEYESYVRAMNIIKEVVKINLESIADLVSYAKRNKYSYQHSTDEVFKKEYKSVLNRIKKLVLTTKKYKEKILLLAGLINGLEDKMTNFIFANSLGMERAYQDNRYTYETEANNNYDNMLILLNCIKRVVGGNNISLPDYKSDFEAIEQQDKTVVIRTSQAEIQVFNRMFSRNDQTFTVNGRKTKTGQISRFFPSKKEPKLDALYSAELRYLGALQTKEENDNMYIAEIALASELYLKSLINSSQTTHGLNELYSMLENQDKLDIIDIVNKILGTTYDNNEFEEIISKKGISQAFEDYRYIYENVPIKEDIEFLTAFVQALHIITEKKLNYKSPYYDEIERTIHPEEDEFHR